jgi:hypothetical protein
MRLAMVLTMLGLRLKSIEIVRCFSPAFKRSAILKLRRVNPLRLTTALEWGCICLLIVPHRASSISYVLKRSSHR